MQKSIHYRKGNYVVICETLSDASAVFDVAEHAPGTAETPVTLYHAESERDAIERCDALARILGNYFAKGERVIHARTGAPARVIADNGALVFCDFGARANPFTHVKREELRRA